jgi:hypothetical protein
MREAAKMAVRGIKRGSGKIARGQQGVGIPETFGSRFAFPVQRLSAECL